MHVKTLAELLWDYLDVLTADNDTIKTHNVPAFKIKRLRRFAVMFDRLSARSKKN